MAELRPQEKQVDELVSLHRQIEKLRSVAAKQADEIRALKEKEGLFREILRRSNDAIVILQDSRVKEINPSVAKILKLPSRRVVNRQYTEFLPRNVLPMVRGLYRRRYKGEDISSVFETSVVDSRGERVPVEINAGVTTYHGKKADLVIIRDLAYIKRAEAEIFRLKPYQETLLENVNIWMEVGDESGKVVVWNAAAEEISGYSREEILGTRRSLELLYPNKAYQRQVQKVFRTRLMKNRVLRSYETRIVCKDGGTKTIAWYAKAIVGRNNRVIGTIVLGLDITARVLAEDALRRDKQTIRALLNAITESIFLADLNGVIIGANSTAVRVWNKGGGDLVGQKIFDLLPPLPAQSLQRHFESVIRSARQVRFEGTCDGRYFDVLIYPVPGAAAAVERLAIFTLDITRRKKAETDLSRQNILLEEKNVALREMIRQVGAEKESVEERVRVNAERLILPLIAKLKTAGSKVDAVYMACLERNLKELTSSFGKQLTAHELQLTQREIEISNMIKNGLTSKQIACLLHISTRTVEIHRGNIRRKLGLKHQEKNLATCLKNLK